MKKGTVKKLSLKRKTLRSLNDTQSSGVAGGIDSESTACYGPTNACNCTPNEVSHCYCHWVTGCTCTCEQGAPACETYTCPPTDTCPPTGVITCVDTCQC
jgi:hypothetical protein